MKRMIDNKDYDNLKNSVDDINTNKLPQYVKNVKENGTYTTYVHNENNENTKIAGVEFVKTQDENNMIESAVVVDETGVFMATNKKVSGVLTTHTLKLDHDGNLTLDGNAVGGGDKLYKHNIGLSSAIKPSYVSFTIINSVSTPYTSLNDIKTYLASLPVVPNYAVNKYVMASGAGLSGTDPLNYYGLVLRDNKIYGVCQLGNTSTYGYEIELPTLDCDIVEPLL